MTDEELTIEWQEPEWTALDADCWAQRFIRKDWLKLELNLFTSKWFDYRFLHPVEATCLYLDAWEKIYRELYAANVDHAAAEHIRPICRRDLFEITDKRRAAISGAWRGRQIADALGLTYEFFIRERMKNRTSFWKRRHLPQPHNLYGSTEQEIEAMSNSLQARWREFQATKFMASELPQYRLENYIGLRAQDDHQDWIVVQARLRLDPCVVLSRALSAGVLPFEKVVTGFGAATAERARALN